MYTKIQITGVLEVKTGMHIGGSSAFAAIGAVDSPVIKDVRTNNPIIPGSSLKGKIRSLLAKKYNKEFAVKPDDDDERLTRLFGTAKKDAVKRSRIIISDMIMKNADELRRQGVLTTEVKFENTINRATSVANPRQIERVVRGAAFDLDIIYEAEKEEEIIEDITTFADGLRLLGYDYLGGNGSRGYGKVAFSDLCAEVIVGELPDSVMEQCNSILQKAII